tara:strand:+ start:1381 stop:1833 length:453 start_codon:yes stop_codon:yes gene_type:complete
MRIRFHIPRDKSIYVLKLEQNKYYIGESINSEKRINAHFNGKGALWTRLYKPLKIIKPITKRQSELWELSETIQRMGYHGIDNIRGSLFTKEYLTDYDKVMAAQLYCEMNNLCRKCGSDNHFINQCQNKYKEPWVYQFGGLLSFKDINKI